MAIALLMAAPSDVHTSKHVSTSRDLHIHTSRATRAMLALLAAAASRLLKQIDSDQGLVTVWETETHKMMLMNSTVIGAEYIDNPAARLPSRAWR